MLFKNKLSLVGKTLIQYPAQSNYIEQWNVVQNICKYGIALEYLEK